LGKENNQTVMTSHFIEIWEVASGKKRLVIVCPDTGYRSSLTQIIVSPDGRRIATSQWDGTIVLWDMATGSELVRHKGTEAPVTSLAISWDGRILAAGYADSTILLWDLTLPKPRASSPIDNSELETLWAGLADSEARKAHAAIWRLILAPQQAVALIQPRIV